ncbi:MAG: STAS domain-containing protein [Kofleriaceae bacterium]|nr:STAS domain-containing protein [Kofleriaceae bacterium]
MTIQPQGDALLIGGAIDEAAALHEMVGRASGGRLVLDLGGVTFINSLGVRDWIRMQAAAQEAGLSVELRRVAEPLVHQLNMIIATRGNATVASFFAPYACDGCGREESLLIDAVANGPGLAALQPPPMKCPECGVQMAFNDFPERYFSFLQG